MYLLRGRSRIVASWQRWASLILITVPLSLLSACQSDANKEAKAANNPPKPRATRVEIATASPGKLVLSKTYLGEVRPKREATLAAGASGEIERLEVREGERVTKDDVLVVIDTDLVSAEIIQAQAARNRLAEEREQALREAERIEALGPEVVPQIEAERERSRARALAASIASQDATIRQARAKRAQHKVIAPFDGVITDRLRDPGDWVGPGTQVMRLVDPANVEIFLPIPAPMAEEIEPGKEVTIVGRSARVAGEVVGIIPELEPTTRTLTLRVAPKQPTSWLLPGDAVDIEIAFERASEGISIPRNAIVRGVTSTHVMVITPENKAKRVEVQIVTGNNDHVLLAKHPDLTSDTKVVTRGNERLRPEALVEIIEPKTSTSGGKP